MMSAINPRREDMKRKTNLYLVLAAAVLLAFSARQITVAAAHNSAPAHSAMPHNAFPADTIQYGPVPPFIPPGAQLAVLEGNPMASTGDFTIRIKMPDGYRFPPHWHPNRENVTVISGTFKLGMGDKFDESKMETFGPGSFAYLDPDMHHYAIASGDAVVQVHGMSPVKFNYVNPNDDPSQKK